MRHVSRAPIIKKKDIIGPSSPSKMDELFSKLCDESGAKSVSGVAFPIFRQAFEPHLPTKSVYALFSKHKTSYGKCLTHPGFKAAVKEAALMLFPASGEAAAIKSLLELFRSPIGRPVNKSERPVAEAESPVAEESPWAVLEGEYGPIMRPFIQRCSAIMDLAYGWEFKTKKKGVDIWLLKEGSQVHSRGEIEFPVPPRILGQFLLTAPLATKQRYDDKLANSTRIQTIGGNTVIMHTEMKPISITQARDFVILSSLFQTKDGVVWLVSKSVVHPDVPVSPKFVRGNIIGGIWRMTPCREGKHTRASLVLQMDPCGKVPGFVVNSTAASRPLNMAKMAKVLEDRSLWPHDGVMDIPLLPEEVEAAINAAPKTTALRVAIPPPPTWLSLLGPVSGIGHTPFITGALTVDVLAAANLPSADMGGTSDPYVAMAIGPPPTGERENDVSHCKWVLPVPDGTRAMECCRSVSSVKKKTLFPKWVNEKHILQIWQPLLSSCLRLAVVDEDLVGEDDLLAEAVVPLMAVTTIQREWKRLGAPPKLDLWLPLYPVGSLKEPVVPVTAGLASPTAKYSRVLRLALLQCWPSSRAAGKPPAVVTVNREDSGIPPSAPAIRVIVDLSVSEAADFSSTLWLKRRLRTVTPPAKGYVQEDPVPSEESLKLEEEPLDIRAAGNLWTCAEQFAALPSKAEGIKRGLEALDSGACVVKSCVGDGEWSVAGIAAVFGALLLLAAALMVPFGLSWTASGLALLGMLVLAVAVVRKHKCRSKYRGRVDELFQLLGGQLPVISRAIDCPLETISRRACSLLDIVGLLGAGALSASLRTVGIAVCCLLVGLVAALLSPCLMWMTVGAVVLLQPIRELLVDVIETALQRVTALGKWRACLHQKKLS